MDKRSVPTVVIATIVSVISIVGTLFAISNNFVSQNEFSTYKEGRAASVDERLNRIESKLDRLIQNLLEEEKK